MDDVPFIKVENTKIHIAAVLGQLAETCLNPLLKFVNNDSLTRALSCGKSYQMISRTV